MNSIKENFEVINFFDECRWSNDENYVLPNMKENISESSKLLTQWLIYIVDRQMDSTKIATEGGPVFSCIADEFLKTEKSIKSFLKIGNNTVNGCFYKATDNSYCFYANKKQFSSRFPLADYRDLYYTLYTLKKLNPTNPSLEKYISNIIKRVLNFENWNENTCEHKAMYLLRGIAYSLYLLTYFGNKSEEKNQIDKTFIFDDLKKHSPTTIIDMIDAYSKKRCKIVNEQIEKLEDYIGYTDNRKNRFKLNKNGLRFNMKRVWCPLRDLLKYQPLKNILKKSLENEGISSEVLNIIFEESIKFLELPGDLWNERAVFKECLAEGCNGDFDFYIRKVYEDEKIAIGYPEQFDVTFNFVRRMCEKGLCEICPLGNGLSKDQFAKFCIGGLDGCENKYCPYVALSCGYKHLCKGNDCFMLKLVSSN